MNETLVNPSQQQPEAPVPAPVEESPATEVGSGQLIAKNEDGSTTQIVAPEDPHSGENEPMPSPEPIPEPATPESVAVPAVESVVEEMTPDPAIIEAAPEVVAPATTEVESDAIVSVKPDVNQERPEAQTDHLGGAALAAAAVGTGLFAGARRLFKKKT